MDYNWLLQAYQLTRKDGATGVDGQTAEMYERQLESNLLNLLDRLKSGQSSPGVTSRLYSKRERSETIFGHTDLRGQDCPESGGDAIGTDL